MIEAFSSDTFFTIVGEPKQHSVKLVQIAEGFLQAYIDVWMTPVYTDMPVEIKDAVGRIVMVCRCLLALLVPRASYLECNATHVSHILRYKGSETMEQTLRLSLTTTTFWIDMTTELTKTAGSTEMLKPRMETSLNLMTSAAFSMEHLADAVDLLPTLREGMRPGATLQFEDVLVDKVMAAAGAVVGSSTVTSTCSRDIKAIDAGMALLAARPGVIDMKNKLEKWTKLRHSDLAAQFVEEMLDRANSVVGDSLPNFDFWELKLALDRCDPIPVIIAQKLAAVMHTVLRRVKMEAGMECQEKNTCERDKR
jgi:hypothetical protein